MEDSLALPTTTTMRSGGRLGHAATVTAGNEEKTSLSWASRMNPRSNRRRRRESRRGHLGEDRSEDDENGGGRVGYATPKSTDKWWKIHLFRGMVNDIRRRAPYYWSDWRDAWDYRVVPATVYMYFAK